MEGRIEWIGVRPERKAPLVVLDSVRVSTEDGLDGDHKASEQRKVTLIAQGALNEAAQELGKEHIDPADARRNLVVSGLAFEELLGKRLSIDDVIIEITGPCRPCSRMDETIGEGGRKALAGKGGLTASVIQGGQIKVGSGVMVMNS